MRRLLVLLAVLVVLGFYVGWPIYSGYEIRSALEAQDAEKLSTKIDLDRLKESLRPAVHAEAERTVKEHLKGAGPAVGILGEEIARRAMPALVELTLRALVTPENIIRIYAERGSVKDTMSRIVGEQMARYGGVTGLGAAGMSRKLAEEAARPAPATGGIVKTVPTETAPPKLPSMPVRTVGAAPEAAAEEKPEDTGYGLSNIKRLGPSGPFSVEVGVAKDPSAPDPDVTIEMSFTGTDWKLTGLRPRI